MSGTDGDDEPLDPIDAQGAAPRPPFGGAGTGRGIVPALTTFGGFAYAGWLMFLLQVVYRTTQVSGNRFGGIWSQRVETLAFITFLPNLVVIALPAAAAIAATVIAGPAQTLELAVLLRLVRWSATAMAIVAAIATFAVVVEEGGGSVGTIAFRFGGALTCGALAQLCRAVGRDSPGG